MKEPQKGVGQKKVGPRRLDTGRVDNIRRQSSETQNHLIDEYSAGKLSRREFIRRGTILGASLPVMSFLAAACSPEDAATTTTPGATTTAGPGTTAAPSTTAQAVESTVRLAIPTPSVGIDPVLIQDEGGLAAFGQTAEYLVFSDAELTPVPVLAESWAPNADGDVWTFTLRSEATFHDGSPVTADDVVATIMGIAGGNAGPAFQTYGVDPDQVVALDERTVEFTLSQPNAAFPFFMSSDNYNAAILPASFWESYAEGSYEQSFIGSGPWILESYDPGVGAVYVKNENYWGDNSGQPNRMEVTFFGDESAPVTAFQEGRLDVIPHISFSGATALLSAPDANVTSISTAQHRQVYFDTLNPPFNDKRVRQAIALTLDRPLLIEGLLGGFGVVGNDHPIWEKFPMYNPDTPVQRAADLATAQQLLEAAGYGDGLEAPLDVLIFFEVEQLAQLIQSSAAQLNGVNLQVGVYDAGTYYNDYWLAANSSMGIVNYGHRAVPHVYLGAPLLSPERTGADSWNASHWSNAAYDTLFDQFTAAADLDSQRAIAGEMQALLNDEVPFIVPYYVDHISVARNTFSGLAVTGMGHYNVVNSSFSG
jgi:peptide/nickel transport system substrate-binding protein